MNNSETILQIILSSIKEKGITEKDCLIACSINTSFFTDWKNRKSSRPSYDKVVRIANHLNIDLNYLFNNKDTSFVNTLSSRERELIVFFRKLNDFDRGNLFGEVRTKAEEADKLLKNVE